MLLLLFNQPAGVTPPDPPPILEEVVPYLIGSTQVPALAAIASIYCIADVTGSGGTVTAQSPAAFSTVNRHTVISITLGGAINSLPGSSRQGLVPYNSTVQ